MSKKRNHRARFQQPTASHSQVVWRWLRRNVIGLVVLAFPMYFASHQLAHIGGNALWLPPEWRGAISALGTGLGLLVFERVRRHARAPIADATNARAHHTLESLNIRKAIACLLLAAALLTGYYGLRYACVFPWTGAKDWIGENFGNRAYAEPEDSRQDGVSEQVGLEGVPPFIDPERSQILIPTWPFRPPSLKHYFDEVAADPQNAGLGSPVIQVLTREPDKIIDCLSGDGRMFLYLQLIPFLLLYLMIVSSVGASIGFPFRAGEALGELLASIVG